MLSVKQNPRLGSIFSASKQMFFQKGAPLGRFSEGWNGRKANSEVQKTNLADGSFYEGNLKRGRPHGQGICVWPNGNTYEGEWVYGVRQGHGVLSFNMGTETYEGNWKANQYNGYGTLKAQDGYVLTGIFIDGLPHGKGHEVFPNGESYDGEFNTGYRHGKGTLKLSDGREYIGQFAMGKKEGQG